LKLVAPIDGWLCGLDEVCDPAFSGGVLGAGLAIDPLGSLLCAPCPGTVLYIHPHGHAVTLKTTGGTEILLHVGIDSINAHESAFHPFVVAGQVVETGDRLIAFEASQVFRAAKSLITPIVALNGGRLNLIRTGNVARGEDIGELVEVLGAEQGQGGGAPVASEPSDAKAEVIVSLSHGLHARPAGQLVQLAASFASRVEILAKGKRSNAESVTELLALGVQGGERVGIEAFGADAEEAVFEIGNLLRPSTKIETLQIKGITAVPGLVVAKTFALKEEMNDPPQCSSGVEAERSKLIAAIEKVEQILEHEKRSAPPELASILDAHLRLLRDPAIIQEAERLLAGNSSAPSAWRESIRQAREKIERIESAHLAGRAADVDDIGRRVLRALIGWTEPNWAAAKGRIVFGSDVSPADIKRLCDAGAVGLCLAGNGPTGHVSIVAATFGLPTVVAMGPELLQAACSKEVILDATKGLLNLQPTRQELSETKLAAKEEKAAKRAYHKRRHEPAKTLDGLGVRVQANIADAEEAAVARKEGAEGAGLIRTEFAFFAREAAPTLLDQERIYEAISRALPVMKLRFRTLDAGADKPLPFVSMPWAENPALGVRGIRVSRRATDLFDHQLTALLTAVPDEQLEIMLPMVNDLSDVEFAKERLALVQKRLGCDRKVPLGVMLETPASVFLVQQISTLCDFFSIGTNDLTQYVLAMDRNCGALSEEASHFHPAVIQAIKHICKNAGNVPVSVCGSAAADPVFVSVAIGLGVSGFSVSPALVARTKAIIRHISARDCQVWAETASEQPTLGAVHAVLQRAIPELGLGDFV